MKTPAKTPRCPRCGSAETLPLVNYGRTVPGRFQCLGCKRWFGPANPSDAGGTGGASKPAATTKSIAARLQRLNSDARDAGIYLVADADAQGVRVLTAEEHDAEDLRSAGTLVRLSGACGGRSTGTSNAPH